jgi:HK97 family phage major capsid protein
MSPRYPVKARPAIHRSSLREWHEDGDKASVHSRAFWRWMETPQGFGDDGDEMLPEDEYRVLSKGASGGGFLVPTDVSDMVTAAARAASAVAQLAQDLQTERGETVNMPLGSTHGTGSWVAESGSYVRGRAESALSLS